MAGRVAGWPVEGGDLRLASTLAGLDLASGGASADSACTPTPRHAKLAAAESEAAKPASGVPAPQKITRHHGLRSCSIGPIGRDSV